MKNKILSITRGSIPYIKELRPIAGSVTAAILMQQLDYWFARYPSGFFKFLEPCEHPAYKEGDSWIEELGFSKDEFRAAFSKIATHYKSKSQFTAVRDPFKGKLYCSYHDRPNGKVFYKRNNDLVDALLDQLQNGSNPVISRKSANPISRDRQGRFAEVGNPDLLLIPEEITSKDYVQRLQELREVASGYPASAPEFSSFGPDGFGSPEGDLSQPKIPQSEQTEQANSLDVIPHKEATRHVAKSISPSPCSARPLPRKTPQEILENPSFDRHGVFKPVGAGRAVQKLTLRAMQFWILEEWAGHGFRVAQAPDSTIWTLDPYDGYWVAEDEMMPLAKMMDLGNGIFEYQSLPYIDTEALNEYVMGVFKDLAASPALVAKYEASSIAFWVLEDEAIESLSWEELKTRE